MSLPLDCGSPAHTIGRRNLLQAGLLGGALWLTPLANALARQAEQSGGESNRPGKRPKSLIFLWLQGAPSQLETFDPHAGTKIGGDTVAIDTNVRGIQFASGMKRTAEQMDKIALVRSVVSREGDHERAAYNVKTGFRPDPTLVHPSVGAVLAHQLDTRGTEIPRHIAILPGQWPGRGGYLGDKYDAFKTGDPRDKLPDVTMRVEEERFRRRLSDLQVVENAFARGRLSKLDEQKTLHRSSIDAAVTMMSSEQLDAFDIEQEPQAVREAFGDTPFGRGCLAAARLVDVGVRCIEVRLGGWDTHINNHELQNGRVDILDPALASLIDYLHQRDRLADTMVLCCGEFGRTPTINPAAGRDHWPHGFSVAMAGGGIAGGQVLGETDPKGSKLEQPEEDKIEPGKGIPIQHIHATVLHAMGVEYDKMMDTPVGRPMALSKGQPLKQLFGT